MHPSFRNAGLDVAHQPTGDFDSYLGFISSLDIGIAHILEEDFALGVPMEIFGIHNTGSCFCVCKSGYL